MLPSLARESAGPTASSILTGAGATPTCTDPSSSFPLRLSEDALNFHLGRLARRGLVRLGYGQDPSPVEDRALPNG